MNFRKYSDSLENEVRTSSVKQFEGPVSFNGLSLKLVLKGKETYWVNSKKIVLQEGEFLIGNSTTQGVAVVNSKTEVEGLCIDLSEKLTRSYLGSTIHPFQDYLFSSDFLVNKYNLTNSALSYYMSGIQQKMARQAIESIDFECLIHQLLSDQSRVFDEMNRFPFKRFNTRKEVYKDLQEVRAYLDNQMNFSFSLSDLEHKFGISTFQLIRHFKNLYGITPYQYIIQLKMKIALERLKKSQSICELAVELGFSDVFSFSKAFKQTIGLSPQHFLKKNN